MDLNDGAARPEILESLKVKVISRLLRETKVADRASSLPMSADRRIQKGDQRRAEQELRLFVRRSRAMVACHSLS